MTDRLFIWYHNHLTAIKIIAIGFIIRIFAAVIIQPGFDESYYGVYSFFPALGYFDHPPFVAFTAGFGLWITGIYTALTLRLGALILFVFTSFLLYYLARQIYGERPAIWSLILFHLTPYFMFGMGAFVIPDNALGLFWLLFLFSLYKVQQSDEPRWFLLSGVAFGLSMMSKYHGIFLAAALFIVLLFYKDWRKYFKSIYLYIGFLTGIIFFLPNLYWNSENDWITLLTQFGKGASGGFNFSFGSLLQAILVQAAYLLPWNMYIYIKASVDTSRDDNNKDNWLIPFVFIPIVIFTLIGGTRQILPHWPMPGYLAAIIITGKWLSQLEIKPRKRLLWTSGIVGGVLISFILFQSITGIVPIIRHGDLTLDGQGWRNVIHYLEDKHGMSDKENFLIGHKWFTGGEMAFAAESNYTTAVFNTHSPHGFAYWVDHRSIAGKDGFFITSERYNFNPQDKFSRYFENITFVDSVYTYRKSGIEAQIFTVWKCKGYKGNFPYKYGPKIVALD